MYRVFFFFEEIRRRNSIVNVLNQDMLENYNEEDLVDLLVNYDVIIFFRPYYTQKLGTAVDIAVDNDIDIYASYDDLVFDVSTYRVSSQYKCGNRSSLVLSRYKAWAEAFHLFDRFIVTTVPLASHVKRCAVNLEDILIVENFVHMRHYDLVREGCISSTIRLNDSKKYIGYFGGGLSHAADIELVSDIVEEFCKQTEATFLLPDVFSDRLSVNLLSVVEFFPRVNFIDMLLLQSKMKFSIAPLIIDDNSECKSGIKFLEATASMVPLIATETHDLTRYKGSPNLRLCSAPQEWLEAMVHYWKYTVTDEAIQESFDVIQACSNHDEFFRNIIAG